MRPRGQPFCDLPIAGQTTFYYGECCVAIAASAFEAFCPKVSDTRFGLNSGSLRLVDLPTADVPVRHYLHARRRVNRVEWALVVVIANFLINRSL